MMLLALARAVEDAPFAPGTPTCIEEGGGEASCLLLPAPQVLRKLFKNRLEEIVLQSIRKVELFVYRQVFRRARPLFVTLGRL